eukprot:m.920365 g.920365  ORF g.920365 m.920365 type:complete len:285 (-) comp63957_c0_seq1:146-1000(-)
MSAAPMSIPAFMAATHLADTDAVRVEFQAEVSQFRALLAENKELQAALTSWRAQVLPPNVSTVPPQVVQTLFSQQLELLDKQSDLRTLQALQDHSHEITSLRQQNEGLKEENAKLRTENAQLRADVEALKLRATAQDGVIAKLQTQVSEQGADLARMRKLFGRLSVREAARQFEHAVALTVTRTLTKAKKHYSFALLAKLDPAEFPLPSGVTPDIVALVARLKDEGDAVAHDVASQEAPTAASLLAAMLDADDDDDTRQDKKFIVSFLEAYYLRTGTAFGSPVW